MYFYKQAGLLALGSRLRRLGDILANDARELFALYTVDLDPRWFPVFYTLTLKGQASVTELAADVGQTHPAVSQVVRQMGDAGLIKVTRDGADSRKRIVSLTDSGRETARRLEPQCRDVELAVTELIEHVGGDFWRGIGRVEALLLESSMAERVRGVRRRRELGNVTIVTFNDAHAAAFRELNLQWIREHWAPELADFKALDNPRTYIIDNGGHIAIALCDGQVVGTCALVRMSQDSYELAKMAVADEARGEGRRPAAGAVRDRESAGAGCHARLPGKQHRPGAGHRALPQAGFLPYRGATVALQPVQHPDGAAVGR